MCVVISGQRGRRAHVRGLDPSLHYHPHNPTPHTNSNFPHPKGTTGQFTNPETRDIARNVPTIMEALGDLTGSVVADVGAGTGKQEFSGW